MKDTMTNVLYRCGAELSPCRNHRFSLYRLWDEEKPYVLFILLNPSIADESVNDPTVVRCMNYAKSWGYGGIYICNLFSLRSTDPKALKAAPGVLLNQYKENNESILLSMTKDAGIVVCGWGNGGNYNNRAHEVLKLLSGSKLLCLDKTSRGNPCHPLYLKKDLKPIPI